MLTPATLNLPPKFVAFRTGQLSAIESLVSNSRRFDLLRAPTGSGKSAIYIAAARALGARVLILVVTKPLQSQLMLDWQPIGLADTRGHSNYPCATLSLDDTGELADLQCTARQSGTCGYWADIETARQSSCVVTNYAHWVTMALAGDPSRLGEFDLIVLDEAHTLVYSDHFVSLVGVKFHASVIGALLGRQLPSGSSAETIDGWVEWAAEMLPLAREKYAAHRDARGDSRTLARLTKLGRDLARLSAETTERKREWVVAENSHNHNRRFARLCPVWSGDYAESHLFRGIGRVVLCSATLSKADAPRLGIGAGEFEFQELPSTFPARLRPFIYAPTSPPINIDSKMSEGELKIVVNRIDSVIDRWQGFKGIVHSRSYDYAEMIFKTSRHRELLLTHRKNTKDEALSAFKLSKAPCVLVSPIVEEGHDFPGDLARFQYLFRVPYVYAKEPLTKARARRDKRYLIDLVAVSLQQTAGRINRSTTDWGYTFISDAHWRHFRMQGAFPGYFRAAWRQLAPGEPIPGPPALHGSVSQRSRAP